MSNSTPVTTIKATSEPLMYRYNPDARVGIDLPMSVWAAMALSAMTLLVILGKLGWRCYVEHTTMARSVTNINDTTNQLLADQKAGFNSLNENVTGLNVRVSIFSESMDGLKNEIKRLEKTVETITSEIQNQKITDERLETKISYIETELKQIQSVLDKLAAAEIKVAQQQQEIERQQKSIEYIFKRIENFKECLT